MAELSLEGGAALGVALQEFLDQFAGNERRLLKSLGVGLVEVARDHFKAEEAPDGSPWLKSRRADGKLKTLQDSRVLYNSLVWRIDESGDLVVGSPLEYAAIHNYGGEIRPRPESGKKSLHFGGVMVQKVVMPKRQFLGWGKDEEGAIRSDLAALARSLSKGAR